jgi:N6-adenosine-specific RNA methylase IME4
MPDQEFDVIVADPPWRYEQKHARPLPYGTMSPEELKSLPVKAAKNALLFMWATGPHIPQAIEVMESWGFSYVTVAFVWKKTARNGKLVCGMGFYTRSCCEYVLLGRRGKGVSSWIQDHSVNQMIEAHKREHSRKPDEFWQCVERLLGPSPGLRKIELFARERRPGWFAWGNQVDFFQGSSM